MVETNPRGVNISNLPNEAFLRKMAFYANRTLITFPFHETDKEYQAIVKRGHTVKLSQNSEIIAFGKYKTRRGGYGGVIEELDGSHHLYRAEFDSFLHLICTARPFLDSEILHVMPSYHPEAKRVSVRTKFGYGLISANFRLDALRKQFTEEEIADVGFGGGVIPYLYLPYFTNIDAKDVLSIRQEEIDLYIGFQRKLKKLLSELPRMKSEKALLGQMEEIDTAIRAMMKKYELMRSTTRKNNVYLGIGFVGLGLAMLLPPELRQQVTTILGGFTALKYFDVRREGDAMRSKFRGEEFYLMWRLVDPKHNR